MISFSLQIRRTGTSELTRKTLVASDKDIASGLDVGFFFREGVEGIADEDGEAENDLKAEMEDGREGKDF